MKLKLKPKLKMEIEYDHCAGYEFKQGEAEGLVERRSERRANKFRRRSEKDALGDSSLDDVSGGGWPYATMNYRSGHSNYLMLWGRRTV